MGMWDDFFGRKFRAAFGSGPAERGPAWPRPPLGAVGPSQANRAARSPLRLFKNNCLTLPWIREKEELDASVQGARADLMRSWNVYRDALKSGRSVARAEDDWRQVLSAFRRHVADLNRRIAAYNLKAPSANFRRPPLDAEREISRLREGAKG